jgi:hypothetical protein
MINLTGRPHDILDYPLLVFPLSWLILWLATRIGASVLRRERKLAQHVRDDLNTVLVTTLTLNGLIIGFSFSMAINRYEQRKQYEEAEANAIGTEYARADLLPTADAAKARLLLSQYLDQRVLYYLAHEEPQIRQIDARTAQLQTELWAVVRGSAGTEPTAVVALTVAGMNDVLNSQGYTQAAWWNRIPTGAWILMAAIAVISQLLIGYGAQNAKAEGALFTVLPFVVSIAFLLIADIDSPRSGIIRVYPQNLASLVVSLRGH